ncbi:hypothetical protein RND71_039708 [Anisodus tanguticus]|uniref:Uncharacterized protein n=1 Tax=Anisodus tanguticus TaxID=243964 RepID=A0AAE1R033_9SOLA|nr:hypothetical protein RND71_039708 [Anisodus tanguticus]
MANISQINMAAIVFEVQRSSRSEAKKEELCRQEMENLSHNQLSTHYMTPISA